MTVDACPLCPDGRLIGFCCSNCCLHKQHWPAVQALKDSNLELTAINLRLVSSHNEADCEIAALKDQILHKDAELELLRGEDEAQRKLLDMVNDAAGVPVDKRPCCWSEQVAVIESLKSQLPQAERQQ